jgi:ABC-type phosphate/phosphonate transport system permease subunit
MLLRALAALLFAGLLWAQARGAEGQPHRRRAFRLGMAAALCMAVYCATLGLGVAPGLLQTLVMGAGALLLLGALVSLMISLSGKEKIARDERIRQMVRVERERVERLRQKQ